MRFEPFDSYREQHPDALAYTSLFSACDFAAPVPSFVFGNVPASLNRMLFGPGRMARVGFYTVSNAVVVRDSVVMHGDTVLTSDATNHPDYHCRHIGAVTRPEALASPRHIPGRVISLVGPGWSTWGHWLADFLPRIHLLAHSVVSGERIRWLLPADVPAYAFEMLRAVGVGRESLVHYDSDEAVQVDQLIVPENLSAGVAMHPAFSRALDWIRGEVFAQPDLPVGKPSKIFVTRASNPDWRRLSNRAEIEQMAIQRGYQVIDPAGLSFLQQVAMFRAATHVAGEYGSGLHTAIFAPSSTVVTCFRGSSPTAGVLQSGLSHALGQPFGYVIGGMTGAENEEFVIDEQDAADAFTAADRIGQIRLDCVVRPAFP